MDIAEQCKDGAQRLTPHEDHKWSELIEIMNELSDYRAHFVVLLARSYLRLERAGK